MRDAANAAAIVAAVHADLARLTSWDAAGLRAVRRRHSQLLKHAPATSVLAAAHALASQGTFECRFMAYELILHHRAALASLRAREVMALGRGINGWAAVDTFALYVAGPAWRGGQLSDAVVQRWTRSRDRWWRRAALVATVALNSKARGGSGDSRRTVALCARLVRDRDDMVVKAMSWALRELAKRDAAAARDFIARFDERLAARVKREVRSKLTTGRKNSSRRA